MSDRTAGLDQPVSQSRLAMVNMRNNAKVSNVFHNGDSSRKRPQNEDYATIPKTRWPAFKPEQPLSRQIGAKPPRPFRPPAEIHRKSENRMDMSLWTINPAIRRRSRDLRDTLTASAHNRKTILNAPKNVTWQHGSESHTAVWESAACSSPPKTIITADDTTTADAAYWRACAGTAMVYQGDFQNAKQLLQAITRRVDRKSVKTAATMLDAFHQHRARQIGRANITNKILIELHNGQCKLNRAPDLREAVEAALGQNPPASLLLSLRETLGMIGANEWRKKGVYVEALKANIHVNYGVYSPVRGEYLDLITQSQFGRPQVAWDIGTGSGVIAAILIARGVQQVIATDSSSRAVQCAAENIERLNMKPNVNLIETSLFPEGKADLIVCNPPWVPARANTPIEHAVYDPKSQMLKAFLSGVKERLNDNGEAWLIMSNLAENIGLRNPDDLRSWITQAGLMVRDKADTTPLHARATDQTDPLYEARSNEVTSLYRLRSAES